MAGLPSSADLADPSASRYELLAKIASGGMATVFVGRVRGAGGFWRLVAIKRAHPHLVENPTYKQMLVDEARLASRLHHPNVVAVLDVEELEGELRLVMDYVEGTSLSELLTRSKEADRRLPGRVAVRIALDACAGLHAAHALADEDGKSLGLVHRDVSPHNILVGIDGVGRLSDFGIAKQAEGGVSTTTGTLKGKIGYMAPEYIEHGQLDARSDVFAMGVVVWEALAGQKLFRGTNELDTLQLVVAARVPALSGAAPWLGERLDDVVAAALARSPEERFSTAQAFAVALETAARRDDLIATHAEVGACVRELAGAALEKRKALIRERTAQPPEARAVEPAAPPDVDRLTVPDRPPPAPSAEGARDASNITLGQPTSFDAPTPPASRWKAGFAVSVAAVALGVAGTLVWRGSLAPAARDGAPATVHAAAVETPAAPGSSVVAEAPSASASAPAASATATPAHPGARPRPHATAAPSAAATVAPNPY